MLIHHLSRGTPEYRMACHHLPGHHAQASTNPNECPLQLPRTAPDWQTPGVPANAPGVEIAASEDRSGAGLAVRGQ